MGEADAESSPDGIPTARPEPIDALRRIDRVLRGTGKPERSLSLALEAALDAFDCDRAWLLFLDVEASTWEVPIERTRPGYPGAHSRRRAHRASAASLELWTEVLESEAPVVFDRRTARPLPGAARRYGVASQMMLRVRPRIGPPWILGLHRCRSSSVWSDDDRRLFLAVRDRLAEGLDRLLLSERLRRSEARLEAVLGALPDPACFKDGQGRWRLANEATLAAFGLEGAPYEGRSDAELSRECTRNRAVLLERARADERAFREGRAVSEEETLCSPTGAERSYEVLRVPLFRRDGKREGLVLFGRDVTEQRETEAEFHHIELSMRNAQKLESLGVLAGGLAHDFNNLLMGVMGYAGLALDEVPEDSPGRSYLQEIESAAERAAELAGQMLAYSGRGRFIVTTFDLGELVEEMLHFLRAAISKKAVLRVSCPRNLPPVRGDVTQIRQVILNLVTNASDATGERGGMIDVVLGTRQADRAYLAGTYFDDELEEGLYVALEVSDTGSGMDEETVARIFDPFFTTKATGRGLGMAAVLGIVRGHEGAIEIRSEPGVGTRFEVLLPAAPPVDAEERA